MSGYIHFRNDGKVSGVSVPLGVISGAILFVAVPILSVVLSAPDWVLWTLAGVIGASAAAWIVLAPTPDRHAEQLAATQAESDRLRGEANSKR